MCVSLEFCACLEQKRIYANSYFSLVMLVGLWLLNCALSPVFIPRNLAIDFFLNPTCLAYCSQPFCLQATVFVVFGIDYVTDQSGFCFQNYRSRLMVVSLPTCWGFAGLPPFSGEEAPVAADWPSEWESLKGCQAWPRRTDPLLKTHLAQN